MKPIIYQVFPRWFTNTVTNTVPDGDISQNGCGKLNHFTPTLLRAIRNLGVTHIWYTGIIEHATATSYEQFGIKSSTPSVVKGKAGSPYAIRDYYDIAPDLAEDVPGRMKEFEKLVLRTHEAGLKVILDFVPNHVAREYFSDAKPRGTEDFGAHDNTDVAFSPDNSFYYMPGQEFISPTGANDYREFPAKATGNDCFTAAPSVNDWYETVKLNYGIDYRDGSQHFSPIPATWQKMLHILRYWAKKGVDAFRCDMAFMVPLEFWHWATEQIKKEFPSIQFIAEIYDTGLYRPFIEYGGFDYLYDKVTLYDTLCAILRGNAPASAITSCWQTVDGINNHMLHFLENHDELRLASSQFMGSAMETLPALIVSATISSAPFMIYAGQELGENAPDAEGFSGHDGRTTIFDYWSIPSLRRWYNGGKCNSSRLLKQEKSLRKTYKKVLNLCNTEKAVACGQFYDLMYVNYNNLDPRFQYVYLRHFKDETILIAVNFSDDTAELNINIPRHAFDFLKIADGNYSATELLTEEKAQLTISSTRQIPVTIRPHGAVMWKFENCGNFSSK